MLQDKKLERLLSAYREIFEQIKTSDNDLGDKQIKGRLLNSIILNFDNKSYISSLFKETNHKSLFLKIIELLTPYFNSELKVYSVEENFWITNYSKEDFKNIIRKDLASSNLLDSDWFSLNSLELDLGGIDNPVWINRITLKFPNKDGVKPFLISNPYLVPGDSINFDLDNSTLEYSIIYIYNTAEQAKEDFNVLNRIMDTKNAYLKLIFENIIDSKGIELYLERISNNTKKYKVQETYLNLNIEVEDETPIEENPFEQSKNERYEKLKKDFTNLVFSINSNHPMIIGYTAIGVPLFLATNRTIAIVWGTIAALLNNSIIKSTLNKSWAYFRNQVPKLQPKWPITRKLDNFKLDLAEKLVGSDKIKK